MNGAPGDSAAFRLFGRALLHLRLVGRRCGKHNFLTLAAGPVDDGHGSHGRRRRRFVRTESGAGSSAAACFAAPADCASADPVLAGLSGAGADGSFDIMAHPAKVTTKAASAHRIRAETESGRRLRSAGRCCPNGALISSRIMPRSRHAVMSGRHRTNRAIE